MTNTSKTTVSSKAYRPAAALVLTLCSALLLPACAVLENRVATEDDIASLNTLLLEQQEVLNKQVSLLESVQEAQGKHHLINESVHSDTLKSLTSLLNRRPERRSCPEPTVVQECSGNSGNNSATDKDVVGELEYVRLQPPDGLYEARIDTGATTSSLDARNIETFERDGEDWVRFTMPAPAGQEEDIEMEEPVARFVRIIQSSTEDYDRRPVVELQYQLGNTKRMAEFNLTDRSNLTHPMLVGRNILRDLLVVDVSQKHSTGQSEQALEMIEEEQE